MKAANAARAALAAGIFAAGFVVVAPPASAEINGWWEKCTSYTPWFCGPGETPLPGNTSSDSGGFNILPNSPIVGGPTTPTSIPATAPSTPYTNAIAGTIPNYSDGVLIPNSGNLSSHYTTMGAKYNYAGKQFDSAVHSSAVNKGSTPDLGAGSVVTVVAWVRKATTGGYLVSKSPTSAAWHIGYGFGANAWGGIWTGGGSLQRVGCVTGCPTTTADPALHMVAFVNNAGAGVLYVDGAINQSTGFTNTAFDPSSPVSLGAHLTIAPTDTLRGEIWDVALFNTALTQGQIQVLYAAGRDAAVYGSGPAPAAIPGKNEIPVTTPTTIASPAATTHTDETSSPFSTLANRFSTTIKGLGDRLMSGTSWLGSSIDRGLSLLGNRVVAGLEWVGNITDAGLRGIESGVHHVWEAVTGGFKWLGDLTTVVIADLKEALLGGLRGVVWAIGSVAGMVQALPGQIVEGIHGVLIPTARPWTELRTAFNTGIGNLIGHPAEVMLAAADALDTPGLYDCAGPTVTMPSAVGGWSYQPLNACSGVPKTVSDFVRPILLAIIWLGMIVGCGQMVARTFGFDLRPAGGGRSTAEGYAG